MWPQLPLQCQMSFKCDGNNEWICFQDCASLRLILCYCWADQTKAAWLSAPRSKARYNALARGAPDVGAHPHQLPCQCEFRSLKWKAGNAPKCIKMLDIQPFPKVTRLSCLQSLVFGIHLDSLTCIKCWVLVGISPLLCAVLTLFLQHIILMIVWVKVHRLVLGM